MAMVLANGFGRVLAVFDSRLQETVVPPGVIDFDDRRTSPIDMPRAILERFGSNNELVGLYAALIFTALSLRFPPIA